MNILIIGGNGFLGKNCVREFSNEHNVTVTGRAAIDSGSKKYEYYSVPLQETETIISLIEEKKIEIIIHMVSSLISSSDMEKYLLDVQNVYQPSVKLLSYCCRKQIKFVYFSSGGAIYGNKKTILHEATSCDPISFYGLSKLNFENTIRFFHNTQGLEYLILRPSNPYGFGQNLYGKQGLIAVIMGKVLNGEVLEIWGDGSALKDYIYIDDFVFYVKELILSSVTWNDTYNIGSGVSSSVSDVVHAFLLNRINLPEIRYINQNSADVNHVVLDCSKLKTRVNYTCMSIEEGIARFWNNVQQNKTSRL